MMLCCDEQQYPAWLRLLGMEELLAAPPPKGWGLGFDATRASSSLTTKGTWFTEGCGLLPWSAKGQEGIPGGDLTEFLPKGLR